VATFFFHPPPYLGLGSSPSTDETPLFRLPVYCFFFPQCPLYPPPFSCSTSPHPKIKINAFFPRSMNFPLSSTFKRIYSLLPAGKCALDTYGSDHPFPPVGLLGHLMSRSHPPLFCFFHYLHSFPLNHIFPRRRQLTCPPH